LESQKIFTEFSGKEKPALAALCRNLLTAQKSSWPRLASAHEDMVNARRRLINCGGYSVTVQFNPQRALSSSAAVDRESIQTRPCFLCAHNLPPEQQGILYRGEYLILCNPAPIFDQHFTIVTLHHQPQEIASSLPRLLQLTADLSPDYTVFYNGPACGASAPDHLHFQASPVSDFPFLNISKTWPLLKEISAVRFSQGKNIDRSVIILEAKNSRAMTEQFMHLLQTIQKILAISNEPMINLLCSYAADSWRLIVFLRRKHRPDAYFAAGEKRIFVSPGAVDMAGIIITPRESDFNRLDCADIGNIYREVSLPEDTMNKIMNKL
jgi:hypothetical protein